MSTATPLPLSPDEPPDAARRPVNRVTLAIAVLAMLALGVEIARLVPIKVVLFAIGCALGFTLYRSAFGFAGAYRRLIAERDLSGITAQIVMLAVAIVLFAPVLDTGEVFGHGVGGAFAPVSVSMALGALLFGVGMQIAGGCASGTLFTAGGGSRRMMIVLVFFCVGCFWGSLHLAWWQELPGIGTVSLGQRYGWSHAVALQLAALAAIYGLLRIAGLRNRRSLSWAADFSWRALLRGPWPLLLGAALLALLNWVTLLVAGHPWSVTWGLTLWAAKAAVALGWDPTTSGFWTGGFQEAALARPILQDTTSVMNVGIILGALLASALAERPVKHSRLSTAGVLTAMLGGLMLGYGARLAYGCNVGAFFSGVASTSLHGWVWIACAFFGNVIGVRLRPALGLQRAAV
jgi:uncharacterized membrane protein YedE/YeeE